MNKSQVLMVERRFPSRRASTKGRRKDTPPAPLRWLFVLLVSLPIIAIPFENHFALFGFSLAKLTIAPLCAAVLVMYPTQLVAIVKQPIMIAGALFVGWATIAEALHQDSNWDFIFRVLQMLVFASVIAAALRTSKALPRVLLAIQGVCLFLAVYLLLNFYGLVDVASTNFKSASNIRQLAFADMSLQANLNILGYTVAMGAVIAVAKLLEPNKPLRRVLWGIVVLICAVGAMVPASRGAFLGLLISCGWTAWRALKGLRTRNQILVLVPVALVIFALMPSSLTQRLTWSGPQNDVRFEKQEGRVRVYTSAIESFPEYWTLGVGVGSYFEEWSKKNGFGGLGPHNGFLAAWIFFGLPGFLLLGSLCVMAGRRYFRTRGNSWESHALFGLLILGLFWLTFTHDLYLKQFGLLLGLLLASPVKQGVLALSRKVKATQWHAPRFGLARGVDKSAVPHLF